MICENKQGNQLPGVLFVLVWTTVVFEWFPFTKWPFNTGQDNRNSSSGLTKGWPRPLNRGDRLIEVKITVINGSNFRDFDNWPLNRGWPLNAGPLNTGPLNTGWTVCNFEMTFGEFCLTYQTIKLHVTGTTPEMIPTPNNPQIDPEMIPIFLLVDPEMMAIKHGTVDCFFVSRLFFFCPFRPPSHFLHLITFECIFNPSINPVLLTHIAVRRLNYMSSQHIKQSLKFISNKIIQARELFCATASSKGSVWLKN